MLKKQSISVYNPSNPLEREIQNSYHKYNSESGWLTSYECQLAARAMASLKLKGEWIYEEELYPIRTGHFFAPEMMGEGNEFIFATNLLFLRDIFENRRISSVLHDPIVFVSKPIAHYLLREYPVHLIINIGEIRDRPFRIGGMRIFEDTAHLEPNFTFDIKINDDISRKYLLSEIEKITLQNDCSLQKAAATKGTDEILRIDEDQLKARVNGWVQNKITKENGKVETIEPGVEGMIIVKYNDGEKVSLTKEDFVKEFVYGV